MVQETIQIIEEWCRDFYPELDTKMGIPFLSHPLFHGFSPVIADKKNGEVSMEQVATERQVDRFIEKYYDRLRRCEDLSEAFILIQRPFRLPLLWTIRNDIGSMMFRELLPDLWEDTEFPHQFEEEKLADLWSLWDFYGGKLYHPSTKSKLLELSNSVTVYRGYSGKKKYSKGFSWTLSKEKALWFAKRLTKSGDKKYLATTTINKSEIMLYTNERGEEEVVLPLDSEREVHIEKIQ